MALALHCIVVKIKTNFIAESIVYTVQIYILIKNYRPVSHELILVPITDMLELVFVHPLV